MSTASGSEISQDSVAAAEATEMGLRTRHMLTLEFGRSGDFDNPRREWRRMFSELFGTFALVLVAAGGGMLAAQGKISLAAAVVAPGLMVASIILFMGAVSGAHLNPAVSLAFALRGDFPWWRVPGYIVMQLAGASLAALFLRLVLGDIEHLGATLPGPGYSNGQALAMEIVLTTLLVSVAATRSHALADRESSIRGSCKRRSVMPRRSTAGKRCRTVCQRPLRRLR